MSYNRAMQPQVNIIQTSNNQLQASPIKYAISANRSVKAVQNGYYIQNGSVQTYFTPIKSVETRNVPHINVASVPTNSSHTSQMSPFQSYNSKLTSAKVIVDTNSSPFSQNIFVSNQIQAPQKNQYYQQQQQHSILDITNQIPQPPPPKTHQQSKRIFEDASSTSSLQSANRLNSKTNQSTLIEQNNTSMGNYSYRGNLRNSSFIRRPDDQDANYTPIFQQANSVLVNKQQRGAGDIKRNSSHDTKVRNLIRESFTYQKPNNRNEVQQQMQRNDISGERMNMESFGDLDRRDHKMNVIRQSDIIPEFKNEQEQTLQISKNKLNYNSNNLLITNNTNNTLKGYTNNTSSSLFVLNTSQDNNQSKQLGTLANFYSHDYQQLQSVSPQQQQQKQQQLQQQQLQLQQQNQFNNIKRDQSGQSLVIHKYTPKQEIFSFENSQINIEDQVETPLNPHQYQYINFTQNVTQQDQNTQELNFFSTNQNNDLESLGFGNEKEGQQLEEQNENNHKVSFLEVSPYDTSDQVRDNKYEEKEQEQEEEEEQQLQQPNRIELTQQNRVKELMAENGMLRSNLQQVKEIYASQQTHIGKLQSLQEENYLFKQQIVQLQSQNEEYSKKLIDIDSNKINEQNTSQNYNSAGLSNADSKSKSNLLEQVKELQEKNEAISKEKFSLMELLFNQEKMYNTLSNELQKQQSSPERLKMSTIIQTVQTPHPKYYQQIEEQVELLQVTINDLKLELTEKDNLIQQMQFDLKDSQKQLGLYSDQILVLKEKLKKREINERQVQLEDEIIALQTQNKNLMDINSHLSKQYDMLEKIKKNAATTATVTTKEINNSRVQLSKHFEKKTENNNYMKPSLGEQAYLNQGMKNNIPPLQYNQQNHDKFINNAKYQSIKNQNQILFTVNSNRKLTAQRGGESPQYDYQTSSYSNNNHY